MRKTMVKDKKTYSRRQFIKGGTAAIAGMALAPNVVGAYASEPKKTKKVRIGVVGGNFGSMFYWHEHPDCIVEAVSDLIPARRKHLQNVYKCDKPYESLEKLILDPDIDAVAVFTGAPDHVRHCKACMEAGKHVICAVPAAINMEQAEELKVVVERTGLSYMMAETSYYRQPTISARQFYKDGKFGDLYYTESEYHHAGLEDLFYDTDGKKTWRYGYPPMFYPTHCTSLLTGITGERLTEVTCVGWGDDSKFLTDNVYNNPFWNQTAFFKTDKGNSFRVAIYWAGAHRGTERAQWYGSDMSFFMPHPNGMPATIVRASGASEKDEAGFVRQLSEFEVYKQPAYYLTDMLPEPMRHSGGHDAAEVFLTHEFIDALMHERTPVIDVYESLAYTVPGLIAHKSSLEGGRQLKVPCMDRKP